MLYMSTLGSNGRFGNQLFQYAALKGIARYHGYNFAIPPSNDDDEYFSHRLFTAFDLSDVNIAEQPDLNARILPEFSFAFDEKLFNNCPDNRNLSGYFQTEKYFAHIREEIIKDFTFREEYTQKPEFKNYVAIHVRLGDYVYKQHFHPVMPSEYYEEAMSFFPKDSNFVVFSDDIEWCKDDPVFEGCQFAEGNDNIRDMYLMSQANHNIIANSSFSWWAAWLNSNPNKIVIAPKLWFHPDAHPYEETLDLIPQSWQRI
jgi:Glycosyl transferase family 11